MSEEKSLTTRDMDFPAMITKFKSEIERALPKHLTADRMCRIALTEFRKNPKLANCDPRSVFAAVIQSAQLGLECGLMGEASLVPYKSECQLIPGYTGLMKLATNTGKVKDIYAHEVRENDTFELTFGLDRTLKHIPLQGKGGFPATEEERGQVVGYYAVGVLADGSRTFQAMSIQEVNKIRDKSNGYKNAVRYGNQSVWNDYPVEMGKKTVIRRICKYLPKSPELAIALSLDSVNEVVGKQSLTVEDAINGTWTPDYSEAAIDVDFQSVDEDPDERFISIFNDAVKAENTSFEALELFVGEVAKKHKLQPEAVKDGAMKDPAKFGTAFKKYLAKQVKPKPEENVPPDMLNIPDVSPVEKHPILCPSQKKGVAPEECSRCASSKKCDQYASYLFDQKQGA